MNVGIVRVPVIDSDPVKFGSEIALRINHQLTDKGAQVGHVSRVLRRDGETEVVTILLTSLRESALVGGVRPSIEHAGVCTIPCYAIAPEIGDVLGERGRAKPVSAMPNHARLDHHPT